MKKREGVWIHKKRKFSDLTKLLPIMLASEIQINKS